MNWFYAKNGAQEGPVSTEALRAKIDSGEVSPTDLAWREGLADWMPVSKIPDFTRQDLLQPTVGYEAPAAPVASSAPVSSASPYVAPASAPASYQQVPVPGQTPSIGLAVASMVCGIVGLLGCCIPFLSEIITLAAIILGHIAISQAKKNPATTGGKGMARAGLVTGYIGLILSVSFQLFTANIARMSPEEVQKLDWLPLSQEQKQQVRDQIERDRAAREKILKEQPPAGN